MGGPRRYDRRQRGLREAKRRLLFELALAVVLVGGLAVAVSVFRPPQRTSSVAQTRAAKTGSRKAETLPAGQGSLESERKSAEATLTLAPYEWASLYGLIAHGFGKLDGMPVTSTREAFEASYDKGYRIFEVDLLFTKDGFIVGRHDWTSARYHMYGQKPPAGGVPTLAQFRDTLVQRKYHPVDAEDIVDLMRTHPDAWLMTDLKAGSVQGRIRGLRQLLQAAKGDDSIRRRLIVQIYEEADLRPTRALGIENVLYTFYRLKTPQSRALDFAEQNGVKVVTMPVGSASPSVIADVRRRGLALALHTVNDPEQASALWEKGVGLLYSDALAP